MLHDSFKGHSNSFDIAITLFGMNPRHASADFATIASKGVWIMWAPSLLKYSFP